MKRVLAILCVLACLCGLCVPVLAAEETVENVRIEAYVPADWSEAYLYVWAGVNGADGIPVEWPGMKMNPEGDGWFSAEIPGNMTNAIVNNGNGVQTQDLDILVGIDQWITVDATMRGEVFYEEPSDDQLPSNEPGAKPEGEYTVHASIPESWSGAYVWAWDDNQTQAFEIWPGLEMVEVNGYFDAAIPVWCNHVLIVEKDGGPQTVDLTVNAGKEQWIVVGEAGAEGKHNAVVFDSEPAGDMAEITIHAMVPADWSNVRVWAWKDASNLAAQPWPGELTMTQDADGWYTLTIAGWVTGALINADANGAVVQTSDIAVESGAEIWIDATTNPSAPTVSTTKPDVEVPTLPDPTEPPATNAPTNGSDATQAPTEAPKGDDNSKPEESEDFTIWIVIGFVIVSAGAIGGALLYKKKQQ